MSINTAEMEFFLKNGYLRLPSFIPLPMLNRVRELFDELMDPQQDSDGKLLHVNKGKTYVTNLEHICRRGNLSCLELLGYPPLLSLAETICGADFFMIQEFAVNKILGDELPVLWHQDMVHERKGRCFTMGVYLDDAEENDGALRVVPGSHLSDKGICELSKETPIEVPMKAGDILIHDMMLAHSSAPLQKNKLRRVVYFEFLSAAHVKAENIYTDELVNRRTRLLFAACRHYQALHPQHSPFKHRKKNPAAEDDSKEIAVILAEIYSEPIRARPSAYCLEAFK